MEMNELSASEAAAAAVKLANDCRASSRWASMRQHLSARDSLYDRIDDLRLHGAVCSGAACGGAGGGGGGGGDVRSVCSSLTGSMPPPYDG